jgi:cystathionine beta-lyase/cystathionine gamma-synthase
MVIINRLLAITKMEESLVLEKQGSKYVYSRTSSSSRHSVSKKLSKIYDCEKNAYPCVVTSGIHAISIALQAVMIDNKWNPIECIMGNELYCETERIFNLVNRDYVNMGIHKFAPEKDDICEVFSKYYTNSTVILFVESESNPSGHVFDFSCVNKLRKLCKKLYLIVDNTWLTGICFNPLKHGADIVVESLTKYYSNGKCIGGMIIGMGQLNNTINDLVKINGIHVSLENTGIINREIDGLEDRIAKSFALTVLIAEFLEKQKKVIGVNYPLLKSHGSYSQHMKWIKYGPSVLTFTINCNRNEARTLMQESDLPYKTSFGSHESKLDPWPKYTKKMGTMCRLAIGHDDTFSDLKKKLTKLLHDVPQ